jgi:dipeptidyl aminopeptidase/acylaminoacyl peptidase
MPLIPGTRIGSYEVVASLGTGGMGEVYRARDTKLNRDVALKILPEAFAADADRLARFRREAQVLASLNHPNIAQVFGLEDAGGVQAIAMELVAGDDLSVRLSQGALSIADSLLIARQIAEGLEAAHELGIVHRDLKPLNIKVRSDGGVKVLDFGLAKALDSSTPHSAPSTQDGGMPDTMTSPAMTQAGIILGTAAYMSPEQARGRPVDKRADIWAFGVVLFEMLTGRPLFRGETVSETLASVIKDVPDLGALPAATPPRLRALVARCLEREPRRRLRDIGEARILLEDPEAGFIPEMSGDASRGSGTRTWFWAAGVAAALLIGAAAMRWLGSPPAPDLPERHFVIHTPDRLRAIEAAISPNGQMVAFTSAERAWVMRLDQGTAQEIPGAAGTRLFFWSPDSAYIGFQNDGRLWKVAASGGTPVQLGAVARDFSASGGAAWLADDRIWYTTGGSGLMEISAQGGASRLVLDIDPAVELDFHEVSALPDGKSVLFTPHRIDAGATTTFEVFDGRERRVVFADRSMQQPVYSPTGHLLFARAAGVWAIGFSLAGWKTNGDPFLVVPDAGRSSVSNDGTLVVAPEGARTDLQLTWADRTSKVLSVLGRGGISVRSPRLSPDGKQVVAHLPGANADLYVFDVERGTDRRLTFDPGLDAFPVWSPDSKFVVYQCDLAICSRHADGSGDAVVLVKDASRPAISPDGKFLLFLRDHGATGRDVFIVPLGPSGLLAPATGAPRPYIVAKSNQNNVDISPDGKFVAYESTEAGEPEVYITTFPGGDGKWQASRFGGGVPRWSRTGDRVFYTNIDRIYEVIVDRTPNPVPRTPTVLVSGAGLGARISPYGFERSLDNSRFLFPRPTTGAAEIGGILLIEQWIKAHRRAQPGPRQ